MDFLAAKRERSKFAVEAEDIIIRDCDTACKWRISCFMLGAFYLAYFTNVLSPPSSFSLLCNLKMQAAEVNLLRGGEGHRRLLEHCEGVTVGTNSALTIGHNPNHPDPAHSAATCTAFCSKYGHPYAHYHSAESGNGMHCRCHNANAVLACASTEGSSVLVDTTHSSVPADFDCPDNC